MQTAARWRRDWRIEKMTWFDETCILLMILANLLLGVIVIVKTQEYMASFYCPPWLTCKWIPILIGLLVMSLPPIITFLYFYAPTGGLRK